MRLSLEQQNIIKNEVHAHFGPDAEIWLFGSRVDDRAKGGDIDLYIETDHPLENILPKELSLHAGLMQKLGDQRIDIVIHQSAAALKEIHKQALATGVRL